MNSDYQDRIDAAEERITAIEKRIRWYRQFAASLVIVGFTSFFVLQYLIMSGSDERKNVLNILGSISGGAVSSLFALAGLVLVYVAFLGQKQQVIYQQIEMIYNKIELELTRSEMRNQQLEMKNQNDTMKLQKFENLFFQLIANYQHCKTSFYIVMDSNRFLEFKDSYYENIGKIDHGGKNDLLVSKFAYNDALIENPAFETTFYYQVNSILKFIYSSDEIIDKELYAEILDNSLSSAEKFCLLLVAELDGGIVSEDRTYIDRSQILKGMKLPQIVR
ncbi:hypothetical protein [Flavobacterium sp. HJSW_4]|uniref:hypothetical protein n=1 Tax=Flavobacterium sp. HJSW_4 TaxID=3344660 RepID=UPI0035F3952F